MWLGLQVECDSRDGLHSVSVLLVKGEMEELAPLFRHLVLLGTIVLVVGVAGITRTMFGYESLDGAIRLGSGVHLALENSADLLKEH